MTDERERPWLEGANLSRKCHDLAFNFISERSTSLTTGEEHLFTMAKIYLKHSINAMEDTVYPRLPSTLYA